MKIVIWFLTFFVSSILNAILGYITGFKLGACLLYIVEYHIGKLLCERWDENHPAKQKEKHSSKNDVTE